MNADNNGEIVGVGMAENSVEKSSVTLRVWWAGHLIREINLEPKGIIAVTETFKEQVRRGELTHLSCGMVMDVDEIVIDSHETFGWRPVDSFKRK